MSTSSPTKHSANLSNESITAFSLTELLVVIAITGIISSLMLPAIKSTYAAAGSIRCTSNLRQCAVAIQSYVSDNEGIAFNWGREGAIDTTWAKKTKDYLGLDEFKSAACPTWTPYSFSSSRWFNAYGFRYSTPPGSNLRITITDGPYSWIYFRWNSTPTASQYAIITDNCGTNPAFTATYGAQFARWEFNPATSEGLPHFRHKGKINILYVDAHTESIDAISYKERLTNEYANPLLSLWGVGKNNDFTKPININ